MSTSERHELIERIHATATPLMLAVAGGGSGAISALLAVPGASATVLEAVVPYAPAALAEWLGGKPDQFCSERTARAMAMAAFERARQLSGGDPSKVRGIGVTASLATTRPKRGEHRVHVAWQSADTTVVTSCELENGTRARVEEEEVATQLVLSAVAEACGVPAVDMQHLKQDRREQHAPPDWTKLLLNQCNAVLIDASASSNPQSRVPPGRRNPKSRLLFPGAFNPVHAAHEQMAAIAEQRFSAPVTWELSIANVDKPPLDFIEVADRLAGLPGRRVLLSRAPTFVEKSAIAPGCTFVVGADTVVRIGEPRYYGDDGGRRDAAVQAIAANGCRFLVFGRKLGERFTSLGDLDLPPALAALCDEVSQADFQIDAASSAIRDEQRAASPEN